MNPLNIYLGNDVNGDGKAGDQDLIFALQSVANIR